MFKIWSAVPTELSWSHFKELIRIDRKEEREFYEQEAIKSNWGYKENLSFSEQSFETVQLGNTDAVTAFLASNFVILQNWMEGQ